MVTPSQATEPTRGHLVIVGGGTRTPDILDRLVELAGGSESRFVIIPVASSQPVEAGVAQAEELKQHGAGKIDVQASASSEDMATAAEAVRNCTGVFMTGGDQSRLAAALEGSALLEELHLLLGRGGVIAGSSAGAAVMGDLMITGNELGVADGDAGFRQLKAQTIERTKGFSFWKGVVVDQHFVRRLRHNRLLSVVIENPEFVGVGIDEATAVVVGPEGDIDVLGWGTVTVYDARAATIKAPDKEGLLAGRNVSLHVLRPGEHFEFDRSDK